MATFNIIGLNVAVIFMWGFIFYLFNFQTQNNPFRLLQLSNSKHDQIFDIIFAETNLNRSLIGIKQMCAIESAAMHNPQANIKIYTLKAQIDPSASYLLDNHPNIKLIQIDPEAIFSDTNNSALLSFWTNGTVQRSRFGYSHLSDFLRIVLIWKHGGIYSDMDIITLKSFQPLIDLNKNGMGYTYDYSDSLNSAILLFPRAKHPFLNHAINKFIREYDGESWAKNGPILILNTIYEFCKVENFLDLELYGFKAALFSDPNHQCSDIALFPENYFYPFSWAREEHQLIFKANSSNDEYLNSKSSDSYTIHFFNQLSSNLIPKPGDNSFYVSIAQRHCPDTYNYVNVNNLEFTP